MEEVRELGAGRVVVTHEGPRPCQSHGPRARGPGAMLWVVRGGKIVSGKLFQSMDEALAATDG